VAWNPAERKFDIAARLPGFGTELSEKSRVTWPISFPKRGLWRLPALSATASQPFGLVSATAPIGRESDILVLPAIGQILSGFELEMQRWMETQPLLTLLGNDELSHLRPYRPGDHPHSVDWKATARRRSLLVMERHSAGSRKVALVVDTHPGPKVWKTERLISAAATLIDHFCTRGWSISLYGLFAPEGLHAARESLLEVLALAEMQSGEIHTVIPDREPAVVLSERYLPERPPNALVLTLAECERFIVLPGRVR
jgi:uncharacterized protein (DUF58 family)